LLFALDLTLDFALKPCRRDRNDRQSARGGRAHHTACAAEGNAFVGWQSGVLC
jgi:hypothetical protein